MARAGDTLGFVKRFYKKASVLQVAEGFEVMLDKRTLRTPSRQPIRLPCPSLALAIAAEWQIQGPYLKPFTMPLMQLTSTALDLPITLQRQAFIDRIQSFIHSDTACYRETQGTLRALQNTHFDPILSHITSKYNFSLPITNGMDIIEVDQTTISALNSVLNGLNDYELVALETAVTVTKSVAIGLSLIDGFVSIEEALKSSRTEEDYQEKLYGRVEGHHDLEEAQSLMLLSAARVLTQLHRI